MVECLTTMRGISDDLQTLVKSDRAPYRPIEEMLDVEVLEELRDALAVGASGLSQALAHPMLKIFAKNLSR
jgi:hypothetical protein